MENPNAYQNDANFSRRGEMFNPADTLRDPGRSASSVSPLDMFAEMRDRLAKVESEHAQMKADLDAAKKSGEADPGLMKKLAHIAVKYFPHDFAEETPVEKPVPKFDPYTGHPLN